MRINSAEIGMDSARTYYTTSSSMRSFTASTQNTLTMGGGLFSDMLNANPDDSEGEAENTKGSGNSVETALDDLKNRIQRSGTNGISNGMEDISKQINKLREECINMLLRLLFPERFCDSKQSCDISMLSNENSNFTGGVTASNVITLSYKQSYYYEESETTSFNAGGVVNCSDGRQIEFGMDIMMSRSFCEYYSEEVDFLAASLTDPLVINLDGSIPKLSDQTFYFDIDCDGVEDEISKLIEGSGFLALDKNEDGTVNDGSELFGAITGNGFEELSRYDDDHDGFIDEDDEIFDKLKIWAMDESGQMKLYSLKEKNVGAIGLMNASTDYSLNSLETNETYGVIRRTGVFLTEDGNVGSITQMDLAKRNKALAAYA